MIIQAKAKLVEPHPLSQGTQSLIDEDMPGLVHIHGQYKEWRGHGLVGGCK